MNLVTNAVQAMPAGGRLTIATEAGPEGTVDLAVSDTGEGIPPANLPKVFEPLYTTRAKGIGLGLAIVKRLVEGNGGTIAVASEPGRGSRFVVRFPTA